MVSMTWPATRPNGSMTGMTPTITREPLSLIPQAPNEAPSKPCAAAHGSNRRKAFGRVIGISARCRQDQVGRGFDAQRMIGEDDAGNYYSRLPDLFPTNCGFF